MKSWTISINNSAILGAVFFVHLCCTLPSSSANTPFPLCAAILEGGRISKPFIQEMHRRGVLESEIRHKLLPPLPLEKIRDRFEKAVQEGKEDVGLPEMQSEARWMLIRLREIQEEAIDLVPKLGFSEDKRATAISALKERLAFVREELSAFLQQPGFSYKKWEALGKEFSLLGVFAENPYEPYERRQKAKNFLEKWMKSPRSPSFPDRHVESPMQKDDWRRLSTIREMSIPELNRWMSRHLAPLEETTVASILDGATLVSWDSAFKRQHDIDHVERQFPKPDTGLSVSTEKVYDVFMDRLSHEIKDGMMKNTVIALWFYIHHEVSWKLLTLQGAIEDRPHYGPEVIMAFDRFVAESERPGYKQNDDWGTARFDLDTFKERFRPHDIGDFFDSGKYPSDQMVRNSWSWLRKLAHDIITGKI